jgi:hypothetical protein
MDVLVDCKCLSILNHFYTNFYSYCDNGTEFKSELLTLANLHGIPIINGRSYYPQTQGFVEKANGIFKDWLLAC